MKTRWIVACVGAVLWSGAHAEEELYCEVSSFNFAWAPVYGGTAIAPNGAVALFDYDFSKNPRAREEVGAENWQSPTRKELGKRFRPGRRVVGSLCPERRAWLRDQLDAVRTASQSKIVDMQSRDGPTQETHCLVFEPGRDSGRFVFLQRFGDSESHSLSPAAPRLSNWLLAVSEEARRRAELPVKDESCIDDPPLAEPVYRDAFAEVRQRALADLTATQQLHCQFAEGNGAWIYGDPPGSFDVPGSLTVVFNLDFTARRARAETFGHVYSVRIDTSVAGLTLTNVEAEKNRVSDVVTVLPHRIGGGETYPALKQEIRLHDDFGAVATRYTGRCVKSGSPTLQPLDQASTK